MEELSEAREPRQRAGRPVGGVSHQSNLPKFSSWAEGEQPQLDSVTLTKHVKQMVDVCMIDVVCVLGVYILWFLHRLCSECMTPTTVVPSVTRSLSPSPPTFLSLNVSQFLTRTSKAVSSSQKCVSTYTCTYSDGTISYDEMLQYFLSANSLLRERFTHRFEEHTFLGTAVCEHCKGMVRATEGC